MVLIKGFEEFIRIVEGFQCFVRMYKDFIQVFKVLLRLLYTDMYKGVFAVFIQVLKKLKRVLKVLMFKKILSMLFKGFERSCYFYGGGRVRAVGRFRFLLYVFEGFGV